MSLVIRSGLNAYDCASVCGVSLLAIFAERGPPQAAAFIHLNARLNAISFGIAGLILTHRYWWIVICSYPDVDGLNSDVNSKQA